MKLGKPIVLLALKANMVGDSDKKVATISAERKMCLSNPADLEEVHSCPICQGETYRRELTVYGVDYCHCQRCTHYFTTLRLRQDALENSMLRTQVIRRPTPIEPYFPTRLRWPPRQEGILALRPNAGRCMAKLSGKRHHGPREGKNRTR